MTWPWIVSEAGVDLGLIETSQLFICKSCCSSSSETQGQLVGTEGFSWAKVYYNWATSPWALTLTELVPEAFEFPAFDWPEKYFSGQSAKGTNRCLLTRS